MKEITLNIKVHKPFGNLFRKKAALIVVENEQGKFLVGTKPLQYPPTITRLLGGGVNEGELEVNAAARELQEELGVKLKTSQLEPLLVITVNAEDDEGIEYNHEAHIYYANIGNVSYQPGDDVKDIQLLSLDELYRLGEAYEALPETLWYKGSEGTYSWLDYAKLYGPAHKLSADAVRARNS